MKTLFFSIWGILLMSWCHAWCQELTVLQPNGKPAADAKVYQFLNERDSNSGGMAGMPMDMDMAMEGETGMGMEMGLGGMMSGEIAPPIASPVTELSLLNGKPLQPFDGRYWAEHTLNAEGKTTLNQQGDRPPSTYSHSMLIVHPSGFSFIPQGSRVSQKHTLRTSGNFLANSINIGQKPGYLTSDYLVLCMWQNGFAYPSCDQYPIREIVNQGLPPGESTESGVDKNNWRFRARFRWYQTAQMGELIRMPPGEVRVTLLPKIVNGKPLTEATAAELEELLIHGGPSKIVVVRGGDENQAIHFDAYRDLRCELPDETNDGLPEWGDRKQSEYRLERFDEPTLAQPSRDDLLSDLAFARFLNRTREQRSAYRPNRIQTAQTARSLLFSLIPDGRYAVFRKDEGEQAVLWMPVRKHVDQANVSVWQLQPGQPNPEDAVALVPSGAAEQREFPQVMPGSPVETKQANAEADTKPSVPESLDTHKQLQLVRKLRSEIESSMRNLSNQRTRLLQLERKLQGKAPSNEPFGGPNANNRAMQQMNNPFGNGNGAIPPSSDPFGGSESDPFAN